jgi:hypothetical protein
MACARAQTVQCSPFAAGPLGRCDSSTAGHGVYQRAVVPDHATRFDHSMKNDGFGSGPEQPGPPTAVAKPRRARRRPARSLDTWAEEIYSAPADKPEGEAQVIVSTRLRKPKVHLMAPATAPFVDLRRYMGRWYEIARLPYFTQRRCAKDVQADYVLGEDDMVYVTNRCTHEDGNVGTAKGVARVVDRGSNARLEISFSHPVRRARAVGRLLDHRPRRRLRLCARRPADPQARLGARPRPEPAGGAGPALDRGVRGEGVSGAGAAAHAPGGDRQRPRPSRRPCCWTSRFSRRRVEAVSSALVGLVAGVRARVLAACWGVAISFRSRFRFGFRTRALAQLRISGRIWSGLSCLPRLVLCTSAWRYAPGSLPDTNTATSAASAASSAVGASSLACARLCARRISVASSGRSRPAGNASA